MTMEQCHPRIVCYKIEGHVLVSAQHHDVLHNTRCRLAHDASQLKHMPVQVDGMNIIALVLHVHAVTPSLTQMKSCWSHCSRHRIRHAIDRPAIESLNRCIVLGKCHLE